MQPGQLESVVRDRYSAAAQTVEPALCCPVQYREDLLKAIPEEVLAKDYGCGDPSQYLQAGETVLDLGSGAGKICFIAAQVVGPTGRVIGVDMTDSMLEVARRNAPIVAGRLGYTNVEFRKGRIQDLALDLERFDRELSLNPVASVDAFFAAEKLASSLRREAPLIPSESVDVVVSNCVLNLVEPAAKQTLFREIHRVLRKGGRAVISDIVADEPVPEHLRNNPELWSGCVSGALTEEAFLDAFGAAGFYGIELLQFAQSPWRAVEGIEFRSVTVRAFKGKEGPCLERNQAVVYLGPFREVADDDGHRFVRGRRQAVCDKTFQLCKQAPYSEQFAFVEPANEIPLSEAAFFGCGTSDRRDPRITKGGRIDASGSAPPCCEPLNATCCPQ